MNKTLADFLYTQRSIIDAEVRQLEIESKQPKDGSKGDDVLRLESSMENQAILHHKRKLELVNKVIEVAWDSQASPS